MRNKIAAIITLLTFMAPTFAETVGIVDYRQLMNNYSKAKSAMSEMQDKRAEMQRYLLDKEQEFKKISSPVQQKTFEDQTAKTFQQKQEALEKYVQRKEAEIDAAINAAIKQVAIENKIDTILDSRVVFYGGIDVTDKVLKKLNFSSTTSAPAK